MSEQNQKIVLGSPLAQRGVQVTLAVVLSIAFLATYWTSTSRPRRPTPQHSDRLSIGETTLLRIDLNTADFRELALLPGVGPILADRIVADRERQGAFRSVSDLQRVHGIGPKKIEQISAICDARSPNESLLSFENAAP